MTTNQLFSLTNGTFSVDFSANIESIEEFSENLLGCLPPAYYVRMLPRIVAGDDILWLDETVSVFVQYIKGHVDEFPSMRI
jgi:hypothetical protein